MGRIVVPVTVAGVVDPGAELRFDALVDTGAYCLTLPREWKPRLGPLPLASEVGVETADGRVVRGEVCGPVRIVIDGCRAMAGEVLFIDVSGDAGYEPLLGYLTLEQAGVVVDMVGHRLVKLPHLDLKRATRTWPAAPSA